MELKAIGKDTDDEWARILKAIEAGEGGKIEGRLIPISKYPRLEEPKPSRIN